MSSDIYEELATLQDGEDRSVPVLGLRGVP
jgi:hypothetical protein